MYYTMNVKYKCQSLYCMFVTAPKSLCVPCINAKATFLKTTKAAKKINNDVTFKHEFKNSILPKVIAPLN